MGGVMGQDQAPNEVRRVWRVCACARAIPAHADTPADPADGDGCGMTRRPLPGTREIEEWHVCEVQPGGPIRQDTSAGLGLPNHQDSCEETAMVGRIVHPVPGGEAS